jgi:hypothetical protein
MGTLLCDPKPVTDAAWIPPSRQLTTVEPWEMRLEDYMAWLRLMMLTVVKVRGEMRRWE